MSINGRITITGTIRGEEDLKRLVDSISDDEPTADGDPLNALLDKDEIRAILVSTIKDGEPLHLDGSARPDVEFDEVRAACREIGLSYVLEVDMDLEEEEPGRTETWTPGLEQPVSLVGPVFGTGPLINPGALLPLLRAGKTEEALRVVTLATDPDAFL